MTIILEPNEVTATSFSGVLGPKPRRVGSVHSHLFHRRRFRLVIVDFLALGRHSCLRELQLAVSITEANLVYYKLVFTTLD